jgi:Protein of unknown function (DUF2971)
VPQFDSEARPRQAALLQRTRLWPCPYRAPSPTCETASRSILTRLDEEFPPKTIRESRGEWLFHYTTLEKAVEHLLPLKRMRLSPFTQMRDPREYAAWAPAVAGFTEASPDEMNRAQADATRRLNDLKSQFKLVSFTLDDPESLTPGEYGRGYARSRLWELYAGLGRGLCLAFDKQATIDELLPQLEALGAVRHGSVRYANRPLSREIFFDLELLLKGRYDEAEERMLSNYMEDLFLTKNTEWSSESEYRFVVRTPDENPVFVDISNSLYGIVLGPETPKQYFPAIRELCNSSNLAVAQLMWWNNKPMLVGIALD